MARECFICCFFEWLTFQKIIHVCLQIWNFDDHQGVTVWCTLSSVKCDPITTPAATVGYPHKSKQTHNNISGCCATPIFSSAADVVEARTIGATYEDKERYGVWWSMKLFSTESTWQVEEPREMFFFLIWFVIYFFFFRWPWFCAFLTLN